MLFIEITNFTRHPKIICQPKQINWSISLWCFLHKFPNTLKASNPLPLPVKKSKFVAWTYKIWNWNNSYKLSIYNWIIFFYLFFSMIKSNQSARKFKSPLGGEKAQLDLPMPIALVSNVLPNMTKYIQT